MKTTIVQNPKYQVEMEQPDLELIVKALSMFAMNMQDSLLPSVREDVRYARLLRKQLLDAEGSVVPLVSAAV